MKLAEYTAADRYIMDSATASQLEDFQQIARTTDFWLVINLGSSANPASLSGIRAQLAKSIPSELYDTDEALIELLRAINRHICSKKPKS